MPIHPMRLAWPCRLWFDFQAVRQLANIRVDPVASPEIANECFRLFVEAADRLPPPLLWLAIRTAAPGP